MIDFTYSKLVQGPVLLTVEQLATLTGVESKTVGDWIAGGSLESVTLADKSVLIPRASAIKKFFPQQSKSSETAVTGLV